MPLTKFEQAYVVHLISEGFYPELYVSPDYTYSASELNEQGAIVSQHRYFCMQLQLPNGSLVSWYMQEETIPSFAKQFARRYGTQNVDSKLLELFVC